MTNKTSDQIAQEAAIDITDQILTALCEGLPSSGVTTKEIFDKFRGPLLGSVKKIILTAIRAATAENRRVIEWQKLTIENRDQRIEELEKENTDTHGRFEKLSDNYNAEEEHHMELIAEKNKRIKELEGALKPFAEQYRTYNNGPPVMYTFDELLAFRRTASEVLEGDAQKEIQTYRDRGLDFVADSLKDELEGDDVD